MDTIKKTVRKFKNCPKCSGHGKLSGYSHVAGGRCFKCGGSGKLSAGFKTIEVPEWEQEGYVHKTDEEIEKAAEEFDYSTLC